MTALVFDLDGTLIDSAPDLHHAANLMLDERGAAPLDLPTIISFIGNGTPKLVERCLRAAKLPTTPEAHGQAHARFMEIYSADPTAHTSLFPGVMAALERLSAAGHSLGICTNKPEAPARDVLRTFGLAEMMGVVIGGDTLPVLKPDPAPLKAAFAALGAEDGVFIGDSDVDAATGAAAGCRFGLFTEGYRKSAVEDLPHSFTFDHFDALPGQIS